MSAHESSFRYRSLRRWITYQAPVIVSVLCCFCWAGVIFAEGNFVARVGPSGEFLELEGQNDGQIIKDYLPLHQRGKIRYFSTGVGLEARQAEYPPFPLKLIFTAGGKPYLTGVEVAIRDLKDHTAVKIPKE